MSKLFQRWSSHFLKSQNNENFELQLQGDEAFVFDCDQTLIHGDIGEACYKYSLEKRWIVSHDAWWKHLLEADFKQQEVLSWRKAYEAEYFIPQSPNSPNLSQELWEAYEHLCLIDVHSAYTYAARVAYQRHPVELALMTEYALQSDQSVRFRPLMQELTEDLQKLAKVWIVSSSHAAIVRVIAHHYQIPSQQVIGIDFRLDERQLYTDELITPSPVDSKKIDAFKTLYPSQPYLMVGDSKYDLPMMGYAKSALFINHNKSEHLTQKTQELNALIIDAHLL